MNAITRFLPAPTTVTEAMKLAEMVAQSTVCPNSFRGKPGDVLIAMQLGSEIGLNPLQSLQGIAVINGKPAIYGDAAMALVRASGLLEDIKEEFDGNAATCTCKRKGQATPIVGSFSLEQAKKAGLLGKTGPWASYPERMLQMRARGFALRDGFADVLAGLITAEEAQDFPTDAPAPVKIDTVTATKDALKAKLLTRAVEDISDKQAAAPTPDAHAASQIDAAIVRTDKIIDDLEDAASYSLELLEKAWKSLTSAERKALGKDELARLKGVAEAAAQARFDAHEKEDLAELHAQTLL